MRRPRSTRAAENAVAWRMAETDLAEGATPPDSADLRRQNIALWLAVAGTIVVSAVYLYALFVWADKPGGHDILIAHYAAIVGVPAAAAVSFILVVLLRQIDGPIEFEGLGFKFRGAAGQVVLWVLCFLAFSGA